jgi:redox-sensitive bicupin YhaK (pirin superfamily)
MAGATPEPPAARRARTIRSVSPPLQPLLGSGLGSRLVIGQGSGLDALDPFPALMHDDVPPWVMFPMHQHRGVEIITYALSGALHHEDSRGNRGTVVAGGVERNLFGRGYLHSETPAGGEPYRGLQLFIVLSPADQHLEPSFQILMPEEVPEVAGDGVRVRVVAGAYEGMATPPATMDEAAMDEAEGGSRRSAVVRSPLVLRNPTLYLDVQLAPGAHVALPVPPEYQGIAYVLGGQGRFGTPAVVAAAHQRLVLEEGEALAVQADETSSEPLRFVLIAGRPLFGAGS